MQQDFKDIQARMREVSEKMGNYLRNNYVEIDVNSLLSRKRLRKEDDEAFLSAILDNNFISLPKETKEACKKLRDDIRSLYLQGEKVSSELREKIERLGKVVTNLWTASVKNNVDELLKQEVQIRQEIDSITTEALKFQRERLQEFLKKLYILERDLKNYHRGFAYTALHFLKSSDANFKDTEKFERMLKLKEGVGQALKDVEKAIKGEERVAEINGKEYPETFDTHAAEGAIHKVKIITPKEREAALEKVKKIADEADELFIENPKPRF